MAASVLPARLTADEIDALLPGRPVRLHGLGSVRIAAGLRHDEQEGRWIVLPPQWKALGVAISVSDRHVEIVPFPASSGR